VTRPGDPRRSALRLRRIPHTHPDRVDDTIVEVLRGGEVVATIYGSREGLHVVSELASINGAFRMEGGAMPVPSWVLPLLAENELCPWCENTGIVKLQAAKGDPCPVCRGRVKAESGRG